MTAAPEGGLDNLGHSHCGIQRAKREMGQMAVLVLLDVILHCGSQEFVDTVERWKGNRIQ